MSLAFVRGIHRWPMVALLIDEHIYHLSLVDYFRYCDTKSLWISIEIVRKYISPAPLLDVISHISLHDICRVFWAVQLNNLSWITVRANSWQSSYREIQQPVHLTKPQIYDWYCLLSYLNSLALWRCGSKFRYTIVKFMIQTSRMSTCCEISLM